MESVLVRRLIYRIFRATKRLIYKYVTSICDSRHFHYTVDLYRIIKNIMFTKQDIINSLAREASLLKHLYEKVTPEMLDYRPSEKQRSIRELLIYMTTMGSNLVHALEEEKYDFEKMKEISAQQTARGVENFSEMLNEQLTIMTEFINGQTDENLSKVLDLFGNGGQSIKSWILEVMLKNFPAYRMMLFLLLKGAGAHHLGTSNVRGGRDMTSNT